jgi:peptidoglycan/xylan/chitin deacetylase (PgdA/CDA1 family)
VRRATQTTLLTCVLALLIASSLATVAFAEPLIPSEEVTTTLTLTGPGVVTAHETATIVATLEDTAGAPVPGQNVTILRLTSSKETTIASGLTDSDGRFSATIKPTSRVVLQARFDGAVGYVASKSARITVDPQVALSLPWTHQDFAYPGEWLPARGTLWPAHSKKSTSTRIVCERRENGKWVEKKTYKTTIVNKSGKSRYVGKFRLPNSGTWRIRIRHDDEAHAKTLSEVQRVTVTNWRARYAGKRVRGLKPPSNMVAITIDDGPNGRTLDICKIFERYGAQGTFFFTRQLLKAGYMGQAKAVYDRGHEVANHTARHDMLTGTYAFDYRSVASTKSTIRDAIGFDPIWVRPMGGGINETGDRAIKNSGQLCALWSIDSYDSHAQYTAPSKLYHNVVDHVRPGDVILLHQTHPESIQALPSICRTLKARGYKMVTLSKLASVSRTR